MPALALSKLAFRGCACGRGCIAFGDLRHPPLLPVPGLARCATYLFLTLVRAG